jgi:hypothetical protein
VTLSRRKRAARRPRRTTAETVVSTHIAVFTWPGGDGQSISVQHDIELVKAALFYADDVEVLSPANQAVRDINKFAAGDSTNLLALLTSLDDDTLRHLGAEGDLDQYRQLLPMLSTLDPDAMRALAASSPEMRDLVDFADVLDEGQSKLASSMAEMRDIAEKMRLDSGVAELESALGKGLVRFNEQITIGEDTDALVAAFVAQLRRYLRDPSKFVLLDDTVAPLAQSMINEGLVRPPDRAVSNAGEAVLGTGFLAKLPALTAAPMDELVDLRLDLDEPLGRYRRKVSQLRGELRTGPFDEHVSAEIDAIWRTEVDPALAEIRQAMADHKLAKELLLALGADLDNFVKGGILPRSFLTIISADVLDLGNLLSATITAGAAVTPTMAKALIARHEGRAAARAHDLFYLYEAGRRLDSTR